MSVLVMIDGRRRDEVPATDSSVLRGDGVFEAIRSYDGSLFRLGEHLERLERSAAALELGLPERSDLTDWLTAAAEESGDCVVRVVITRGDVVPGAEAPGRCVIVTHPATPSGPVSLWPVSAPWHPAGDEWPLAGAKTISYAPHMAATRQAKKAGADDALLVSSDGLVLEGPTFSVAWCRQGQVFVPPLSLGVLDSITRRVVGEIWPDMTEKTIALSDLEEADEVFAMSTTKEVVPVVAVGEVQFEPGELTAEIAQRFEVLRGQEV